MRAKAYVADTQNVVVATGCAPIATSNRMSHALFYEPIRCRKDCVHAPCGTRLLIISSLEFLLGIGNRRSRDSFLRFSEQRYNQFQTYPSSFRKFSQMIQGVPNQFSDSFQRVGGCVFCLEILINSYSQRVFREFPESFQKVSRDFSETFQRLSRHLPENFQRVSRDFPEAVFRGSRGADAGAQDSNFQVTNFAERGPKTFSFQKGFDAKGNVRPACAHAYATVVFAHVYGRQPLWARPERWPDVRAFGQ